MKTKFIVLLSVLTSIYISPSLAQEKVQFRAMVTDEHGTALSDVNILLLPDHIQGKTSSNGIFQIKNLYAGTYQYSISAMGYENLSAEIELPLKKSELLKLQLKKADHTLEEVLIQETRKHTPTLIDPKNAGMPVTVIDRKTIELMGSRRLDEVLKEQTGISIVSNTSGGSRSIGLQLQGFSSEYIMVLIDGQPMLGRNSGNFDLSRISVANIERIEIIKGASSCLYGSDALGGAINIITRLGSVNPQVHTNLSYGSFNTIDATVEGETSIHKNKGSALVSANYFRTDGFNTNKQYMESGTTVPPYEIYSVQAKLRHQVKDSHHYVGATGRYNYRSSDMSRAYGPEFSTSDSQRETDINASVFYDSRWNDSWKSLSTYYLSFYQSDISIQQDQHQSNLMSDKFSQHIHRLEQQFAYQGADINLTFGFGAAIESMNVAQTFDANNQKNSFAYIQGNKKITRLLSAVGGLRYDGTEGYGGRLNPSLGLSYELLPTLTLKTGIGTGFKAPDFRTRYQVFYNPTANYYVIGNQVLSETIDRMEANGEISEKRTYVINQLNQNLKAERNTSFNAGLVWKPSELTSLEFNYFNHQLKNQINSIQVATGMQNMAIYSYQNLPRAVNKGFDISMTMRALPHLTITAGYQYLIAKDLSVIDSIKAGNWPYNQNIHDPATGNSYAPRPKDYWGIENRSRHQFNIGVIYQIQPWDITINARANFRGKYPFGDRNGNQFIDKYDLFVNSFILYNVSIEKKFKSNPFSIRLAGENLTNYVNYLIPGQIGRSITLGLSYRIIKK